MLYSQPSGGVMRGSNILDMMNSNTAYTWICDRHGFAALKQWEGNKIVTPGMNTIDPYVYRVAYESVKQYGDCSADVEAAYIDADSDSYESGYLLTRPFFFRHVYRPIDQYPVKMTLHKVSGPVASTVQTSSPRISTSVQDSQNLGLRFVPILINTDGFCIPSDSFTNDAYDVKFAYSSSSPAGTSFKEAEFLFSTHDPAHTTKQDYMIVGGMFLYDGLDSHQTAANFISPDSGRFVGQKYGLTEVTVTGCVVAGNAMSDYPSASLYWFQAPAWASNNVYMLTQYGIPYESDVSVQKFRGDYMIQKMNSNASFSLRPSVSPSFSLPGITTPNLGVRPETLVLVGGGILLLAYLSNRNKGLSDLGQSTTGAVTNVADALGNTAGLVANVSDKANKGINALWDIGYGVGKASADGWTSVSETISKISSSGSSALSGGVPSLKTSVPAPVASSGLLISSQTAKTVGSSVGSVVSSVVSSLSPVSVGLKTGAKVGSVVGNILAKK